MTLIQIKDLKSAFEIYIFGKSDFRIRILPVVPDSRSSGVFPVVSCEVHGLSLTHSDLSGLRRSWFGLQMIPVPYSWSQWPRLWHFKKEKSPIILCRLAKSRFTVEKVYCRLFPHVPCVWFVLLSSRCFVLLVTVKHVNCFCFSGFAGFLVLDSIPFFFFLFPCMQSCFIQIRYCSNILTIPELFPVALSASRRARRLFSPLCCLKQSADGRRVVPLLSVTTLARLVCRVASLDGFIYKFVIHYSWNQKQPSRCKQTACLRFLVLRTKKNKLWWAGLGFVGVFLWECFLY